MLKLVVVTALTALFIILSPLQLAAAPQTETTKPIQADQAVPLSPPTTTSLPGSAVVPILIYHSVRDYRRADSAAARRYIIPPKTLEAELNILKEKGYMTIGFDGLEAHLTLGRPLPRPAVIISFDDGWISQDTNTLPLLKKHGFKATFFNFTNSIGKKNYMNTEQLSQLLKDGMWIGSHSVSHPYLSRLKKQATVRREIFDSKNILEEKIGAPVSAFAYPFGQYTGTITDLVKEAGYTTARGTYFGTRHTQAELFSLTGLINITSVTRVETDLTRARREEEAPPTVPPPGIDPAEYN